MGHCLLWLTLYSNVNSGQVAKLLSYLTSRLKMKKSYLLATQWKNTSSDRVIKWPNSSKMRKTFKKLYEQKDLVRNTKDQYGVVCDNIWQQSHQRLSLTKGLLCPDFPSHHSSLNASYETLHLDFFDIKSSKKNPSSKNRYTVQTISTTPYQKNWLSEVSTSPSSRTAALSDWLMTVSKTSAEVTKSSDLFVKNIEIKSNRKNTTTLLRRDDASTAPEGRSVVNNALEKYSKRTKIKTLAK